MMNTKIDEKKLINIINNHDHINLITMKSSFESQFNKSFNQVIKSQIYHPSDLIIITYFSDKKVLKDAIIQQLYNPTNFTESYILLEDRQFVLNDIYPLISMDLIDKLESNQQAKQDILYSQLENSQGRQNYQEFSFLWFYFSDIIVQNTNKFKVLLTQEKGLVNEFLNTILR
eukprot:EST47854.1 Hypothetical protein SS50377_12045 [Spironucleus salmonicida]